MKVDLMVAGVLLLFGALGMLSGAIRQLSHAVGVLAAYLATGRTAAALAPLLSQRLQLPSALMHVILSSLLFLLFLAAGSAAAHFALMGFFQDREDGRADRAFGFLIGVGKSAAVTFALLSALLFFERPGVYGKPGSETERSRVVAFVRAHNLFSELRLPALDGLKRVMAQARDRGPDKALAANPELKALLEDPRVQSILRDGGLQRALRAGREELMNDPRVRELLNDPDALHRLSRLQPAVAKP
ncbi:MAG TPA: CvpA family protein [Elusimicrobiota bacterium]|nr:CvpA family protein [Elusimicrobiota bacterium]